MRSKHTTHCLIHRVGSGKCLYHKKEELKISLRNFMLASYSINPPSRSPCPRFRLLLGAILCEMDLPKAYAVPKT